MPCVTPIAQNAFGLAAVTVELLLCETKKDYSILFCASLRCSLYFFVHMHTMKIC